MSEKPTGVSLEFDNFWKGEAIKIAAQEQLNIADDLDLPNMFKRAKIIYVEGYRNNVHTWQEVAKSMIAIDDAIKTETRPKPEIKKAKNIPEGKKQCPKCGDLVLESWKKHAYRETGEKCGHNF